MKLCTSYSSSCHCPIVTLSSSNNENETFWYRQTQVHLKNGCENWERDTVNVNTTTFINTCSRDDRRVNESRSTVHVGQVLHYCFRCRNLNSFFSITDLHRYGHYTNPTDSMGTEAEFAVFPLGWIQMLHDSWGDRNIVPEFCRYKDALLNLQWQKESITLGRTYCGDGRGGDKTLQIWRFGGQKWKLTIYETCMHCPCSSELSVTDESGQSHLQQTSNVSAVGNWCSQLKSTSVGCRFCRSIPYGTGNKINLFAKTNYWQLTNLNHFLSSEVANIKWSSKFSHPVLLIM